jgi:hypothetical protein
MRILKHGTVCRVPGHPLGYFAWPSVALDALNRLIIDPFGKTVAHLSEDLGETWSEPIIINDGPLDDRDAGVAVLPSGDWIVSWFTSDTRRYTESLRRLPLGVRQVALETVGRWTDLLVNDYLGGFIRTGTPEKGFSAPLEIGVTAPHGPIVRKDGSLFYLGKGFRGAEPMPEKQGADYPRVSAPALDMGARFRVAPVYALESRDGGRNWTCLGQVPLAGGVENDNLHEPHAVELSDGSLLGVIRVEHSGSARACPRFGLMKTFSRDGGRTWTPVEDMGI